MVKLVEQPAAHTAVGFRPCTASLYLQQALGLVALPGFAGVVVESEGLRGAVGHGSATVALPICLGPRRRISTASPKKVQCSPTGTANRAAPPVARRLSPGSRPSAPASPRSAC